LHEGCELSGYGGNNSIPVFTLCHQFPESGTQSSLTLPGNVYDFFSQIFLTLEQATCNPCLMTVSLSCFNEYSAGMAIASFGYFASLFHVTA